MGSFTVNGSDLYAALSIVTKCLSANPEALVIRAFKQKIEIRAYGNQLTLLTVVNTTEAVEESVEFCAPLDRLKALCNRRGPMLFTLEDQMLKYKALSGNYRGDMSVTGTTPIEILFKPTIPTVPLVDISEFLPFVDLNPVIGKEMALFIVVQDNMMYLASGDNYHAVLVALHKDAPDLQLMLPMAYQKLFASVFGTKPYTLHLDDRFFFARNSTVLLQLPLVDAGDITFAQIKDYVETEHPVLAAFSAPATPIKEIIDSLRSINDDTKSVKMAIKADRLVLAMQSSIGKASDEMLVTNLKKRSDKAQPDTVQRVSLSFNMLSEVLTKVAKTATVDAYLCEKSVKFVCHHNDSTITYLLANVSADED